MGPAALLPIREERVLRIFIALKNPSPWPGSNPKPLGPVASTLTTTPPKRRFSCCIFHLQGNVSTFSHPCLIIFLK
jgi:hypothetical protein